MDIKSIVKNLDISWFKVLTMTIFNKEALYEYVLDKANTAVNALLSSNKENIAAVRDKLAKLNGYLIRYADYLPAQWLPDAQRINETLLTIYRVTEDFQVTSDELSTVAEKFQIAYSGFKAED